MDIDEVVARVDAQLRARGRPERAEREKAYLRSELEHLGTPVPAIRAVARDLVSKGPSLEREELVSIVEALWEAPVHERRSAAVEVLRLGADRMEPEDLEVVERLLREARTWALVDPLAASVAERLVERSPVLNTTLDRWAADDDFWIRRSALLALLVPLRRGDGDFDRFSRYADGMLEEREFFVRKAIGWVLRDTARKRPGLVFEWLLPRASRASGVTIREAVKPLSEGQRRAVLAVRRTPARGRA